MLGVLELVVAHVVLDRCGCQGQPEPTRDATRPPEPAGSMMSWADDGPWLCDALRPLTAGCGPSATHAHRPRRLPRSAGRSAHDCRDEPSAAEEDQEGEDRNAKKADDAVLSGHEAYAPGVDEQAGAEHDDACPEATMSEYWDRHRGERTRRGMGEAGSPVTWCRWRAGGRRRPFSAVQVRCWSRPTTRLPLRSDLS